MKSHWIKKIAMLGVLFCLAINVKGADYERTKDVIYGRKHGVALTMDVITPAKQNNRGVIFAVSGGWFSSHDNIDKAMDRGTFLELLKRGYTVLAVVHGSQPKFTVPEILEDMHRAVRFIRHHAELYKIDLANICMFGGSAGGHLTLLQGTDGQDGDPSADGPTLLIHGDADLLVPIQQSKLILSKFKQEGVEAELLTMPGKNHGWKAEPEEIKRFGDWFDKHVLRGE